MMTTIVIFVWVSLIIYFIYLVFHLNVVEKDLAEEETYQLIRLIEEDTNEYTEMLVEPIVAAILPIIELLVEAMRPILEIYNCFFETIFGEI